MCEGRRGPLSAAPTKPHRSARAAQQSLMDRMDTPPRRMSFCDDGAIRASLHQSSLYIFKRAARSRRVGLSPSSLFRRTQSKLTVFPELVIWHSCLLITIGKNTQNQDDPARAIQLHPYPACVVQTLPRFPPESIRT